MKARDVNLPRYSMTSSAIASKGSTLIKPFRQWRN
jgi:hypothetical protein